MSAIEAVAAIRTDDHPYSIEILVAHVDHTLPDPATSVGTDAFPEDFGVITLDLPTAQALRTRLDAAIQALERSEVPREAA